MKSTEKLIGLRKKDGVWVEVYQQQKKASGFHLTEVHHGWDRWDSHQSIYRYQIKI